MGGFSIWHWLIVLLIVLLVFGTKRLKNIGEDLGGAVKGFKEGMNDIDETSKSKVELLSAKKEEKEVIDANLEEKVQS